MERVKGLWALYRERIAAAQEGRELEADTEDRQRREQEAAAAYVPPALRDGSDRNILFGICTVISYIVIVGMAFGVHPLLGLVFLVVALPIAPVVAGLFMVGATLALFATIIIGGVIALVYYSADTAAPEPAATERNANRTPDLARIKCNVHKMVEAGATEGDIRTYVINEGVTAQQVREYKGYTARCPEYAR